MARGTGTFALLALVALAAAASGARAQSIGSFVGGIVGDVIDGVDSRTFFQPNRGCQRRPPKDPRDLRAQARSPTSVRLTWRARDNSCVDFYEVTWTAEGRPLPRTFSPRKVTDYTVDIDGLDPNTRYVFSVRAVNNANGASSIAAARTTTPPQQRCSGPPRPPSGLQTRSDSPTTLTVSWVVPAGGDPCVERYEVTYLMEGQTVAPRSLAPLFVEDRTVTLSNLQPNTGYNVVVAAVGSNGQRSTVTTRGRTQPLCNPLRAPVNLSARQSGPRSVRAAWTNTQRSCARATQVSYQDGSGNRGPIVQLGGTEEQYTFANLQPGQQYTFSVRLVGRDGSNGAPATARVFLPNNSQGGTVTVPGRR